MSSNTKFRDRYGPWAIVTGASSGIGKAIARELAAWGLNLVLVSRSRGKLDELQCEINGDFTIESRALAIDLSEKVGLGHLAEKTDDLDVGLLIAAAGFGSSGPFLDAELENELGMLELNCGSTLSLLHRFGRRFKTRKKSGIVLFGSILGFHGVPNSANYAATKAYVQALGEALSVEFKPIGIDVITSAPGPTQSAFADRAGLVMNNAMSPETVALATLKRLGRSHTVLPGFLSKFLHYSMTGLPRWIKVQILGRVMSGMRGKNVNGKSQNLTEGARNG